MFNKYTIQRTNKVLREPQTEKFSLTMNKEANSVNKWTYARLVEQFPTAKNIKVETIAKHTTEYFTKVEIDDEVMIFLKSLRATTIPVFGIEYV